MRPWYRNCNLSSRLVTVTVRGERCVRRAEVGRKYKSDKWRKEGGRRWEVGDDQGLLLGTLGYSSPSV